MGQRLVVEIQKDGRTIAGIYYHWSAYTMSALYTVKDIVNCLTDKENRIKDLRLRLIRFVENEGGCIDGGIDSDEYKSISEMYPNEKFVEHGSRNHGLIALTEDGINAIRDWSEGTIYINLDTKEITNWVIFNYQNIDDYNDFMQENKTLEDIEELNINIIDIRFEDLKYVIDKLDNFGGYLFRNGNEIYQLIE